MLKRFFYASASILMLAVAYHLEATSAKAQSGGETVVGVSTGTPADVGGTLVLTASGNLYAGPDGAGVPNPNSWVPVGNIPAMASHPEASLFTALSVNGGLPKAVTASGDVFIMYGDVPGWQYWGNVFGGPTPAAHATWGQVKAGYRK
jgi:hypothetical protein